MVKIVPKDLEDYFILTISASGNEWSEKINNSFKKLSQKIKIPGFRNGKAPKAIINKYISNIEVYNDATNTIIKNELPKFWSDGKNKKIIELLLDVSQPEINPKKLDDNELELELKYAKVPNIEIPKINSLKSPITDLKKITNEDVENEILKLVSKDTMLSPMGNDFKLANGYNANIDFVGSRNGVNFEGGTGKNYDLIIGSNSFIPGFESQMIGMKTNDTKDIKLKFPDNYHEKSLAGQEVVFNVKINSISEVKKPELNDEYIKELKISNVNNEKELRKYLLKQLEEMEFQQKLMQNKEVITKKLLEGSKIQTIPDILINGEKERLNKQLDEQLKKSNITMEQYLSKMNKTNDDIEKQLIEEAKKNIILSLAINKLIDNLKLEATENDIEEYIAKFAKLYYISPDILKKQMNGNYDYLKTIILQEKVFKELSK